MTGVLRRIIQAGSARVAVKAAKTIPIIGTAVAISLVGYEIRKKGLIKGLVNTALDATPFVGVAKNAIELVTGDWLPDKPGLETRVINADSTRRDDRRKQVAA